jgi:hypothetical protein
MLQGLRTRSASPVFTFTARDALDGFTKFFEARIDDG